MKIKDATPLFRQYMEIKEQHPDKLVLFQLGDFFELYGDDAETASKVLNILLTKRSHKEQTIPMAGFPVHTLDNYVPKLVRAGHKVVICEQLESAQATKGLVKRGATRIISIGTAVEELLSEYDYPKLMGICLDNDTASFAVLDKLKGCFYQSKSAIKELNSILISYSPSEIVLPPGQKISPHTISIPIHNINNAKSSYEDPITLLLDYLKQLEPGSKQSFDINSEDNKRLLLDGFAISGLEIFENQGEGTNEGTLLKAVDETVTSMGKRLLKDTIIKPFVDRKKIEERLDKVEYLTKKKPLLDGIRSTLRQLCDLDRIIIKIINFRINPKEIATLKSAINTSKDVLRRSEGIVKTTIENNIKKILDRLEEVIVEDPPTNIQDGNFIKGGYNNELDSLSTKEKALLDQLTRIESVEKSRTKINNLRIGYNDIFGYYIEVTKGNKDKVPQTYMRVQTLKNVERYTTSELQSIQNKLKGIAEKKKAIEKQIYAELLNFLFNSVKPLQELSGLIATVDLLCSFATLAINRNYTRPIITDNGTIILKDSRHPVLDKIQCDKFIPNDFKITADRKFILVTGPNMAGKSTYIRQVAQIVLLAQIGSFVPASSAEITPVDNIYCRIGSSDRLFKGESTFMVEMKEVSHILANATENSLIILDEVGRGTSTFDGLAIAWAMSEYIHDKIGARTLFATHYSELVKLTEKLKKMSVLKSKISEWRGEIVYLYKFEEGVAEKSYGIHVAKLAKLPKELINTANTLLARLEKISKEKGLALNQGALVAREQELFTLISKKELNNLKKLLAKIADINVENLTPIEALNLLKQLVDESRAA